MKLFLCGFPGSGKDTVADILWRHAAFENLKFARGVYDVAHSYFGMPEGTKDRKLLQGIGNWARSIDKDFWIKQLLAKVKTSEACGKNIIVTDCRFTNEYKELVQNGFTGIHVSCPKETCIERLIARDGSAQLETLSGPSEVQYLEFKDKCISLDNSRTMVDLESQVIGLFSFLRSNRVA